MSDIGDRLRWAREAKGLSQHQLAERAGVSQPAVSRIESGLDTNPGTDLLRSLAVVLGTSLDYLGGHAVPEDDFDITDPELNLWFHQLKELSQEQIDFLKRLLRPHINEMRRHRG